MVTPRRYAQRRERVCATVGSWLEEEVNCSGKQTFDLITETVGNGLTVISVAIYRCTCILRKLTRFPKALIVHEVN